MFLLSALVSSSKSFTGKCFSYYVVSYLVLPSRGDCYLTLLDLGAGSLDLELMLHALEKLRSISPDIRGTAFISFCFD